MTWAVYNDAIVTVLSGITGIGRAHKLRRLAQNDTTFKALYSVNNIVNAWEVSRTATTEERKNLRVSDPAQSRRMHTFTLYGYYGIQDDAETELTFQALLEDIATAFRGDVTLGGVADWSEAIQILTVERREIYNIGVHYAELLLNVREDIDP